MRADSDAVRRILVPYHHAEPLPKMADAFGAADLDPAEHELLAASAIRRIDDVAGLATAPLPPPPWYVHLDIDVIDPALLPPLRFPAPGGPSIDAVENALRGLASRGAVLAL